MTSHWNAVPQVGGLRSANPPYVSVLSVHSGDRAEARKLEFVVHAELEEIDRLPHADGLGIDHGDARERYGRRRNADMVVLGEHTPVIGERIFDAAADRPAPAVETRAAGAERERNGVAEQKRSRGCSNMPCRNQGNLRR